jgi:hypothetical protein
MNSGFAGESGAGGYSRNESRDDSADCAAVCTGALKMEPGPAGCTKYIEEKNSQRTTKVSLPETSSKTLSPVSLGN